MKKTAFVGGAGGFIGGHLVRRLLDEGYDVTCADSKLRSQWGRWHEDAIKLDGIDLGVEFNADHAVRDADEVYNLAADMGGIGFIENNKLDCMMSVRASTAMIRAAMKGGASRYFYSSSACVYAAEHQLGTDAIPLTEAMAYPAMAEDGYGWEKLFSERMCRHAFEDAGLQTRVARYHNVYGPHGSWKGGREKAPAAICRKIAEAVIFNKSEIEIWGDGEAVRTFMYVDDCVEGTLRIMRGDDHQPVNLGSSRAISINDLATLIMSRIAEVDLKIVHVPGAEGVRGRSSDNTEIIRRYGWEPSPGLMTGLRKTYSWIFNEISTGFGL